MTNIQCPKCNNSFDDVPTKLIRLKDPFRMLYKCPECKELLLTLFAEEQLV